MILDSWFDLSKSQRAALGKSDNYHYKEKIGMQLEKEGCNCTKERDEKRVHLKRKEIIILKWLS